jgi:phage repressor protein C with HTH and peptisase S24 domain
MWLSSDYRLKQELSWTKERREKASRFLAALSTENWRNIEYRKLISIKMQKSIQEKWLDPIYREKVINSLNSTDSRKKISDGAKRRYTNVNERKKTSEKTKEKWKDPEYREMMILSQRGKYVGANNKLTGTRWAWVNRNNETKKIPLDELEHFLECGWIRGIGKKV